MIERVVIDGFKRLQCSSCKEIDFVQTYSLPIEDTAEIGWCENSNCPDYGIVFMLYFWRG